MKYYRIIRDCGYSCGGCEEEYLQVNDEWDLADIEKEVEDGFMEWAESMTHFAFGYYDDVTEEEFEEFYEHCYYAVEEVTAEEFSENS